MKYQNGKMQDMKIAYIGGGSRGWAWTFMADLSMEPQMEGTVHLYDINLEAAKTNAQIGNDLSQAPNTVGQWKYEVANTLEDALTEADFVMISILPGTLDEMEVDVHYPEKYGIYQSVGDTAGPGGLVRSLRTVPMFVEIAKAIKAYSPKAWVINYTNPMSMCMKTLYNVFPEIKAFGCCHEVFGTQKVLKAMCEEALDLKDIDRRDIVVNVLGINHFTWFDQASYKGVDLFPIYQAYINEHQEGFDEADKNWANSTFECAHLVKFDLFNRFGLIAAAGDRHLAEFMPYSDYLKDPETVASWKFGLTTVEWRKNDYEKRLNRAKKLVNQEDSLVLKPSGEEGILLIKALCGLERIMSNVNIPNTCKQISNLDTTVIVETNAVFEKDAIRPIFAGEIPSKVKALMNAHIENHDLIYEAATECSFEKALKALMQDPLVHNKLSEAEATEMLRTMIAKTKQYLPKNWE